MNVPLPTDNIYKFIALAGIAVFLGAPYLGESNYRDIDREYWQHITEYEVQQVRLEILGERIDRVSINNEPISADAFDSETDASIARINRLRQIRRELEILMDEFAEEQIADMDARLEHAYLTAELTRARWIRRMMWVFSVAGLIVSTVGFRLWWVRVQVPLDKQAIS